MTVQFDHVAIQVTSLDEALKHFQSLSCDVGEIEEFAEEGTREVYIGADGLVGRLLLIESIGQGPYERSLAKRGPGLHHVAVAVRGVEAFASSLSGTGWFLHPQSLVTMRELHTVWLARPGVPVLVEVCSGAPSEAKSTKSFVSMVEIPVPEELDSLFTTLGVDEIKRSRDDQVWLTFDGHRIPCSQLCS